MSRRAMLLSCAILALAALEGCTCLQYRADDAADMFDLGVTWSEKPSFALYSNSPLLLPVGWGRVDGYFAGIGGGQVGATCHYEDCVGLVAWGREGTAWHNYDLAKPETVNVQGVGPFASLLGPFGKSTYVPAMTTYVHLGYLGVAANARYMEIIDFFLGWLGADVARDDGTRRAQWPWEEEEEPREVARPEPSRATVSAKPLPPGLPLP